MGSSECHGARQTEKDTVTYLSPKQARSAPSGSWVKKAEGEEGREMEEGGEAGECG